MRGGKLGDAFVKRLGRARHRAPHEVVVGPPQVQARLQERRVQHRRLFRREHKGLVVEQIEKRLDAEAVAGGEESAALNVEDREAPHAVEALEAGLAPLGIACEQHLGVGLGMKSMTAALQLASKVAVVVDLAVIDDPQSAVGGAHRLVAGGRRIENRQTPVPEPQAARQHHRPSDMSGRRLERVVAAVAPDLPVTRVIDEIPLVVRPSMTESVRGALEHGRVERVSESVKTDYAAHDQSRSDAKAT